MGPLFPSDAATCSAMMNSSISSSVRNWLSLELCSSSVAVDAASVVLDIGALMLLKPFSDAVSSYLCKYVISSV